ncbi:helix-turn-helix domain-containing protein [Gellertiella hungarica]|nr:helix-turn-helix domain-containing protein [Gellertiella hungarica]
MISSEQVRAARALVRWDQSKLAAEAGVSVETIKRLEKMDGPLLAATGTTLSKIQTALEAAGVEFIDGTGVKLKQR